MKYWVGFFLGVLFTYIVGAVVAWDLNPGNWTGLWRFICLPSALLWGIIGGAIANDRNRKKTVKYRGGIINGK